MQADEHAHDYCARELMRLHHRSRLLDSAVVLGAIGGGLSCFAALLLFIGAFGRSVAAANVLLAVFGLALTMTIGSIAAFVGEMALSSRAIRPEISVRQSHGNSEWLSKDSSRTVTTGRRPDRGSRPLPTAGFRASAPAAEEW
jgi:Protein of unknown function (DUF2721)